MISSFSKNLPGGQSIGRVVFIALIIAALTIGAVCIWNAVQWLDKPFPGFLVNQRMVVGYIGQYHWTGTQAGLKYPDKILRANGKEVSSAKVLEEIVLNTKVGTPIQYQVKREAEVISVTVPTMRFTGIDLVDLRHHFFPGHLLSFARNYRISSQARCDDQLGFFCACLLQGVSSFVSFDLETTHFGFVRLIFSTMPFCLLSFSISACCSPKDRGWSTNVRVFSLFPI